MNYEVVCSGVSVYLNKHKFIKQHHTNFSFTARDFNPAINADLVNLIFGFYSLRHHCAFASVVGCSLIR